MKESCIVGPRIIGFLYREKKTSRFTVNITIFLKHDLATLKIFVQPMPSLPVYGVTMSFLFFHYIIKKCYVILIF